MIKEVLQLTGWGEWQAASLVIFMVFMLGVILWAYRPGARAAYRALGERVLEEDKVRPHVHDGIEEYDNPLPRWWVGFFYFTIIFTVLYLGYYHFAGGPSSLDEMQSALAKQGEASAAKASDGGEASANLATMLQDKGIIAAGGEVFKQNCSPCHGQAGEGVVGPNLTDKFWLHGGKPENIYKTIADGVVEKGMISWAPILGVEKVKHVTAYVVSLKGTNPPNGKASEGQPEE